MRGQRFEHVTTAMGEAPPPCGGLVATMDPDYTDLDVGWWMANYPTVAQIRLKSNPLLHRTPTAADVKPRLLGHWSISPELHPHLGPGFCW